MRRLLCFSGCLCLLCSILLTACSGGDSAPKTAQVPHTVNGSNEPVTYSINAQDVLIRTLYGGGLKGTLSISPQISIYGDGTYVLGLNRKGKLNSDELQQLLNALVNTYGVLNFKHQQFVDMPDLNATFLELSLNGKGTELVYGSFRDPAESAQDRDEYQRLGAAITAINQALKGPTQPYQGSRYVLLARQIFNPDFTQTIPGWPLTEYSLEHVTLFECGALPPDDTSPNKESGCLKYTIPQHTVLLNNEQAQTLKERLDNHLQGTFREFGIYYEVTLRPLLPDELARKQVAMFGSAQSGYKGISVQEGAIPVITPTPDL